MSESIDIPQNLPREVLRWIQSLDLAYSVKNIKRDFSNGFLVAEIFSRYYAKEIQMHSYDNGNALKAKRDNWNQLLRIFRKIGLAHIVTEEEADLILRCEDNAAIVFINKIYEVLTQRKIQTQVKKPTVGRQAGYAKQTGSWKVRSALRRDDLNDDSDQLSVTRRAAAVVEDHEKTLQEERSLDPDRFSIATSVGNKSVQMSLRNNIDNDNDRDGGNGDGGPQVRVKEIQVKQLDRNVTHLRASKQMQGQGQGGSGNGSVNGSSPVSINKGVPRTVTPSGSKVMEKSIASNSSPGDRYQGGGLLPENAISVINSCITRIMGPENFPSWSTDQEAYQNFMNAVELQKNGAELDDLISETLDEIRLSAQQLADACVVTPKQFWRVSDLLCTVLISSTYQSGIFSAAAECFESIGRWTAVREPKASLAMFCDFALFKLANTLISNSYKRLGILRVLLAFAPQDSQSKFQCIKRLQNIVPDLNLFISCLTILAAHESQLDDALMDLYLYYGTIGLGLPSPRLRAGAMSVFASLLPQADEIVAAMLPQLSQVASQETWWEIHAHLLTLCGSLLEVFGLRGPATERAEETKLQENTTSDLAIDIVKKIFSSKSSRNLRHWGIVALAPGLAIGEPLVSLYLNVLVTSDAEDRRFFLGLSGNYSSNSNIIQQRDAVKKLPLPSSSGIPFVLEPVTVRWHPVPVAKAIENIVKTSELDRLEPEYLEVFHACVRSASNGGNFEHESLGGVWKDLYASLKDYVFVAFCDRDSCDSAAGIMLCYVERSPMHESVLKEVRFTGILRLLYPEEGEGDAQCQRAVESFLKDVYSMGEPYSSVVISIIEQFAKNFTIQFELSGLQELLKEIAT